MKFFIYLCCIAHLLAGISARMRLTTPIPSSRRSNDDAALNIAEMIDFVNSVVYYDDSSSIARSGRLDDPMLRRYELPAVNVNLPGSVAVINDEDTENLLENLEDTVRYHVIDNPEVLEEYSNKQKQKNNEKLLNPVTAVPDINADTTAFSTVENKLTYYHSKSTSDASPISNDNNNIDELLHKPQPTTLDGVQELTTVEFTYRPSFPDDDDDDDKLVTEDREVTVTEREINKPSVEAKNYDDIKIKNIVEIENRTLDNKASAKEDEAQIEVKEVQIEEENAQIDDTKVQIKQELPLKVNKNNDGVTVNEEKSGSNKEIRSSKLDYNSNERLNEANVSPSDENNKIDGTEKKNGSTDTNSEKENEPIESSTNKIISVSIVDKLAFRTKKNYNRDRKEQHSIYSDKKINENSTEQFKNMHVKRDKYDRKKTDKNDDAWSKKEKDWNKIDTKIYIKENEYDTMEYQWNNRHQQDGKNDDWNINDYQWDKNDDFSSRDRDSYKRENDWYKRDNDWKKRDSDFNKRDNNWDRRENEWIKKDSKSHKYDRNKNDWDRKQNEWGSKSDINIENDRDIANERYEIVERKTKDSDYNGHSEV